MSCSLYRGCRCVQVTLTQAAGGAGRGKDVGSGSCLRAARLSELENVPPTGVRCAAPRRASYTSQRGQLSSGWRRPASGASCHSPGSGWAPCLLPQMGCSPYTTPLPLYWRLDPSAGAALHAGPTPSHKAHVARRLP